MQTYLLTLRQGHPHTRARAHTHQYAVARAPTPLIQAARQVRAASDEARGHCDSTQAMARPEQAKVEVTMLL